MQIAIIANGEIVSYKITKELLKPFDFIIAVDGGLLHCHEMQVKPNLIIGDLDSVSSQLLSLYASVPLLKFPEEKDESDLELALVEAKKHNATTITLFGVLGKRTDHLLYTLNILARDPQNINIQSENEIIFYLNKEQTIACNLGQTISLIPLNPVKNVTTKGLKWDLNKSGLNKNFMSLSNICLHNTFSISFESGDLLCCMQMSV